MLARAGTRSFGYPPHMTSRLRHIALHAEEPHAGRFVWVLSERVGTTTWKEIQRADEPVASYKKAMAAGLVALHGLADDLEAGPRATAAASTEDEDSENAASGGDDTEAAHKGPAPKKSVFGFGPAR